MQNSTVLAVEKQVLDVYQKENPSTYNIEERKDLFDRIERSSHQLYTDSLKILPKVFDGANLLEFGAGTGERSMTFLRWNANCTFVDMNHKALERADFLFKKYFPSGNYKLIEKSLFEFESEEKFDITVSKGVIHHTNDKEKAFKKQVSFLKPGGINILGIGTSAGCFQRNLQRYIIYTFAGRDENEIERIANDLFTEHLDRAEKFGGRSRKAIIYDTYVNPKMDFISMAELLSWYKKYGLTFYSSWPPVIPSILADNLAGNTDWRNFPELLSFPEWIWATQQSSDEELAEVLEKEVRPRTSSFRKMTEAMNDVQAENLNPGEIRDHIANVYHSFSKNGIKSLRDIRAFRTWLNEISRVMEALDKKDYNSVSSIIKENNQLFRGRLGVGLNYFVAIKE
ncbi:class I SAM-dependent methyltransferase [Rhodohalobacter sp. 614A]|uniref:class I SAM-dependent methyltransferase n=1 Tax=Rhodohalobacter sp. 614A TaxID=2908649 RepID=UPI001F1A2493|nr:methyltransferase domain-containing protein [Rhodohalobacter sp. 614A]